MKGAKSSKVKDVKGQNEEFICCLVCHTLVFSHLSNLPDHVDFVIKPTFLPSFLWHDNIRWVRITSANCYEVPTAIAVMGCE